MFYIERRGTARTVQCHFCRASCLINSDVSDASSIFHILRAQCILHLPHDCRPMANVFLSEKAHGGATVRDSRSPATVRIISCNIALGPRHSFADNIFEQLLPCRHSLLEG